MPVTDYDFKVQRVYGAKQQPYAIGSDIVLRVAGNASMPAEGYPSLANGSQVVVFVIDQPPTGLAGARTASVLPVASPNDIAIVAAERLTWAGKVWDLNTFSDDLQKHPSPN